MSLTKVAIIFGIIFLIIGVLGFIPGLTMNGLLLGVFSVNLLHNIIHLVTGGLALLSAMNEKYTKLFFQVFGIIYLIIALLGFFMMGGMVMGMQMNLADNIFHIVVALISLYFGFLYKRISS